MKKLFWILVFSGVIFCQQRVYGFNWRGGDEKKDVKAISVEQLPKNEYRLVADRAQGDSAGLFVGVNEFDEDDGLASLNCAVNDAIGQAHVFVRELKLIPAENCILCISGDPSTGVAMTQLKLLEKDGVEISKASKSRILRSLTSMCRVPYKKKDMLVVSLSTHGFEDKKGVYLMPSDGMRRFLDDTALFTGTLRDSVSKSKAGKKLLILDACRERVEKSKSSGSGRAMTSNFSKAFAASYGFATLMSCSVGQFSYEDEKRGHGVFTAHLLDALRGKAYPDKRGFITVDTIGDYVTSGVRKWMVRYKPDVAEENIPRPDIHGPNIARDIPLAIGKELTSSQIANARKQYETILPDVGRVSEMSILPTSEVEVESTGSAIANAEISTLKDKKQTYKYGVINLEKIYPKFTGDCRVSITSSRRGQPSVVISGKNHPGRGHSVFTWHLIKALKGEGDTNKDGVVTVDEVWDFVKDSTETTARQQGSNQQPQLKGQIGSRSALTINAEYLAQNRQQTAEMKRKKEARLKKLKEYFLGNKISLDIYQISKDLLEAGGNELDEIDRAKLAQVISAVDGKLDPGELELAFYGIETPRQRIERMKRKQVRVHTVRESEINVPNRYALVIGAERYIDERIPRLPACSNDAKKLYDVLTDPSVGMFSSKNVTLLLDEKVTRDRVVDVLGMLSRKANKDDLVVVFFSGYGAVDEKGRSYWVMHDSKIDRLRPTALAESDITELLSEIKTNRLVIFMDTCYSASTRHNK